MLFEADPFLGLSGPAVAPEGRKPTEKSGAGTKPYEIIRFGAQDVTKAHEIIGIGALDVTKPCEFIGFGAMDVTKPYEFIGFWAMTWPLSAQLGRPPPHRPDASPRTRRGSVPEPTRLPPARQLKRHSMKLQVSPEPYKFTGFGARDRVYSGRIEAASGQLQHVQRRRGLGT